MSAQAIAALVAALNGIHDLDACSHDEKIAAAKKILQRAPTSLLPVEIAERIGRGGSRLRTKLQTEPMNNARRLGFVGALACDISDVSPAPTKKFATGGGNESEFVRNELREMRACRMEVVGHLSMSERHALSHQIEAIEGWRRTRFSAAATRPPWWALHGYDSPEDYEAKRQPKTPKAPIPSAKRRRGTMELGAILDPITNDDTADLPPVPDEDEAEQIAIAIGGG